MTRVMAAKVPDKARPRLRRPGDRERKETRLSVG